MTWGWEWSVSYTHLDVYKRQLLPIGAQTVKAAGDTLYVFDLESYLGSLGASTKVQYDYLKFATALQGLANRDQPQIYFMFKNTRCV